MEYKVKVKELKPNTKPEEGYTLCGEFEDLQYQETGRHSTPLTVIGLVGELVEKVNLDLIQGKTLEVTVKLV